MGSVCGRKGLPKLKWTVFDSIIIMLIIKYRESTKGKKMLVDECKHSQGGVMIILYTETFMHTYFVCVTYFIYTVNSMLLRL